MTPIAPPSPAPERLMSRFAAAALDALAQGLPPASSAPAAVGTKTAPREIEPAPWVSLTKAQCVLLAIALHRVSSGSAEKLP